MIAGNGEAVVLEIPHSIRIKKMFNSTYIIHQLHYIDLLKKKVFHSHPPVLVLTYVPYMKNYTP